MLRIAVLLLVLANGLFYAWSQGLLAGVGLAPAPRGEPQRLQRQIQPERLRLLNAEELQRLEPPAPPSSAALAASAPSPAPMPIPAPATGASGPAAALAGGECLRAGPYFDPVQIERLRQALVALRLAEGSWRMEGVPEPARWIVYMGPYANPELVARKRSELRVIGVRYEPLLNPSMEPGLSLGAHASQAAANTALADLARRGVRTARVVQELPERTGQWLRLPQADEALKRRLNGPGVPLFGRPLRTCPG